ncbi:MULTISPECIES: MotE family protein [Rhizobium]|uniref:Flagellar motility protein MotE, a chaperone for MotC folding n=1 Tax=Rhizobium miluonense TaxID=411945 RepID=A0A1C3TUS2_9HYPH|nr:MotE family protein [Rhizobium miluonense]SCB06981.1 Flagellar motility protein MotE, a chaperone for MotC folding [Rhizobium miluonense]
MISIVIARRMLISACLATTAMLLSLDTTVAQQAAKPVVDPASSQDEIRQFCTNIADPARDQRYLLQKQDLEKLRGDIDQRIATMDKRKAEYEDWLKRRDDFLKTADLGLVDIYKNMKPDAAAASLNEVRTVVAAAIIMKLSPRQSSLILAEMDAKKAGVIANIIASASNPNTSKSKDPS